MDNSFPEWLTNPMFAGAKGFNLDAYIMALEGWRRGLTLKWYYDPINVTDLKIIGFNPLGKTFSLSSSEATHFFYRSRGDQVANEAVNIVTNKDDAKSYLNRMNVPTPASKRYMETNTNEEIIQGAASIGYPMVIKPTFGSLGKGVVINIQSSEMLATSLQHVRNELGFKDIIVERFVEGKDARIYVINNKVVAATRRIPANVTGDGKNTIKGLIEAKNNQRQRNPYLSSKLIDIDTDLISHLNSSNYTIKSIIPKGDIIYLRSQSNIALGGDPVDITDEISNEVREIAIESVKSIPRLLHAGVDVLLNGEKTSVIEINGTADVGMHIFPMQGQPRNVPETVIDYYFPDTIGCAKECTMIYFGYKKIRQLFLNKDVTELTIPQAPPGKLYAKRFVISGKVQKVGYRNWIRKQALKQGLNGYTRNLNNGKVVVVVGSDKSEKVDNFKDLCLQGSPQAKVEDVQEYEWEKQVRVGFEIRKNKR